MTTRANQIFVNLPVKDLNATKTFFGKIGFEFNPQFTDENAACMVIGDNMFAMLLAQDFFRTFINKEIADATKTTEVLVALSTDSREKVDEIVGSAIAAGGTEPKEAMDHGFMYQRSFQDLDGHIWEVFYMDPSAVQQG